MTEIPQSELVPTSQLKVDGDNPNRMTPKQLDQLKGSIKKFGFIVPIITNKDLLVADGEQRLTAAKELGLPKVSVIRLNVEDVDRRLIRQVMNKLCGEHDLIADALEFERIIELGSEDKLKELLDLSDSQLERYFAEIREPRPEVYDIPEIEKVETSIVRGDIHKLGNHRLMCGDATSRDDVLRLMNGEKADMVFTDPPYGVNYDNYARQSWKKKFRTSKKRWGLIIGDDGVETFQKVTPILREVVKENGSMYVCSSSRNSPKFATILANNDIYCATPIIWAKRQPTLSWERYHPQHEQIFFCGEGAKPTGSKSVWYGPKNETTLWYVEEEATTNRLHPTQKPVGLPRRAILNSSMNPDIVADLFGGSGSTLIACEQTGRRCYMMEIDPRYCQVIVDRWEAYTGLKAEKISG